MELLPLALPFGTCDNKPTIIHVKFNNVKPNRLSAHFRVNYKLRAAT